MSTLGASGGIAAPIFVAGELWGALGAAYSERTIPAGAETRLERFARLVGLTISNTEAFAWLIPEAHQEGACAAADRVRAAIANEPFPDIGTVTVSAGVRFADPSDDADTLVNAADQAHYRAKDSGRNMTFLFSDQVLQPLL